MEIKYYVKWFGLFCSNSSSCGTMKAIKHVLLTFFCGIGFGFQTTLLCLFLWNRLQRVFLDPFRLILGGTGTISFLTVDICLIRDKLISFIKCLGKYLIHLIGLIEIKTEKRPFHYGYLFTQIISINCKNFSLIFFKSYGTFG